MTRESHAGLHFYGLFQCCPRKFYFKYVLRLKEKYTAAHLIFGSAFHAGKAQWYETGSRAAAITTAVNHVQDRKEEYRFEDEHETHIDRVETLLDTWIDRHGQRDLEKYDVVEVEAEQEIGLNAAPGYYITVRRDTVLSPKGSDDLLGMETKTSSFSASLAALGVQLGDQATAYLLGLRIKYPDRRIIGMQPDISYWNKKSHRVENINHHRGDLVFRSDQQLEEFDFGISSVIIDISKRVEKLREDPELELFLFPRNTAWCNSFFRPCEYADICRDCPLSEDGPVPEGFERDDTESLLGDYVDDPVIGYS